MTNNFRKLFVKDSAENILLYEYKSKLVNAMTFPHHRDGTNAVEEIKKQLRKNRKPKNIITSVYNNSNTKLQKIKLLLNRQHKIGDAYNITDDGLVELFLNYPIPIMYGEQLPILLNERECVAVFLHEIGHHIIQVKMDSKLSILILQILNIINFCIRVYSIFLPPVFFLYLLIALILLIPNNTYERNLEYSSDSFAALLGYDNEIVSSLRKIDGEFEKHIKGLNMLYKISYSVNAFFNKYLKIGTHPTVDDREINVKQTMNESYIRINENILNNLYNDIVNNIDNVLEYALT